MIGNELCGNEIPNAIVSTGNHLFIRFKHVLPTVPMFRLKVEGKGTVIEN